MIEDALSESDKIRTVEFWRWFKKVQGGLLANLQDEAILSELDRMVSAFADGSLSWEIGPGSKAKHSLVISPSGQKELLELAKAIVAAAPAVDNWEFHSARPVKMWDYRFLVQTTQGEEIEVDATRWEYVLLQFHDGKFDLILRMIPWLNLSSEDRLASGEILTDGVLGELERLERICSVEVVKTFGEAMKGSSCPIRLLKEHVDSLK